MVEEGWKGGRVEEGKRDGRVEEGKRDGRLEEGRMEDWKRDGRMEEGWKDAPIFHPSVLPSYFLNKKFLCNFSDEILSHNSVAFCVGM